MNVCKKSKGFTRTPSLLLELTNKVQCLIIDRINLIKSIFRHTNRSKGMRANLVSGFTLIELLVVIAIIGILSSVVLASLNTARNKGMNAAVKLNIANLRTQADIFYSDNFQSYSNLCTSSAQFISILGVATTTGGGPTSTVSTYCQSDANTWSAASFLKVAENNNNAWCAGSSGVSKATTTVIVGTANWVTTSCQ